VTNEQREKYRAVVEEQRRKDDVEEGKEAPWLFLDEFIRRLQVIRDAHGNMPVIMVDGEPAYPRYSLSLCKWVNAEPDDPVVYITDRPRADEL
jgi:hypothetical protein